MSHPLYSRDNKNQLVIYSHELNTLYLLVIITQRHVTEVYTDWAHQIWPHWGGVERKTMSTCQQPVDGKYPWNKYPDSFLPAHVVL